MYKHVRFTTTLTINLDVLIFQTWHPTQSTVASAVQKRRSNEQWPDFRAGSQNYSRPTSPPRLRLCEWLTFSFHCYQHSMITIGLWLSHVRISMVPGFVIESHQDFQGNIHLGLRVSQRLFPALLQRLVCEWHQKVEESRIIVRNSPIMIKGTVKVAAGYQRNVAQLYV